jgi:hypothetical protein
MVSRGRSMKEWLRSSTEEIAKTLDKIVLFVKAHKDAIR